MKDKWQTLEHSGPLFPKEYEYIGFDKKLSSLAEEMLYHYSAKLETEYVSNPTFNKNFWNDLKPQLPKEYQSKTLEDFLPLCTEIFKYIQKKKETKPTKEEKLSIEIEKEKLRDVYGFCTLNGDKQPLASFYIEGPGILITRGKNPQLGHWKFRITPEDVVINATNFKDIKPPTGHTWKLAHENKQSTFLINYFFVLSNGRKINKFIQFSAKSIVKQNSDQKKFDKAKLLIKNWARVDEHINKGMLSKDPCILQSATVLYLIKNLGIRVGDEKDSDLADTKGASTLCKENFSLEGNTLRLSFLGKDSVKFTGQLKLPDNVQIVLENLLSKTKSGEMLFPSVTSIDVNNYLSEVIDVTAKVFRTAYGSSLLAENLRLVDKQLSLNEKIIAFNEANLIVAKKLNHQKQIGKSVKETDSKFKEKLELYYSTFEDLKKQYKPLIKDLKEKIVNLKNKDLTKESKQVLKVSYEKKISVYEERIDKAHSKAEDFELTYKFKKQTANVALATSKTNYSDPRIGISWCKDYQVPVEKLYSKTLQEKFSWALDCENDYYSKYITITT